MQYDLLIKNVQVVRPNADSTPAADIGIKGEKPIKLAAGGFLAVPPHHVMDFSCVSESQLFLLTGGTFEIHYVNDAGNEISPQQALATGRRSAAAKKK